MYNTYSHAEGGGVGAEEQEQFLVADADAVVDPRTVVVHLDDAPLAKAAVMRTRRLEGVAPASRGVLRQPFSRVRNLKKNYITRQVELFFLPFCGEKSQVKYF